MAKEVAADAKIEFADKKSELIVEELISRRAYELFEQRGFVHGYHVEDWLQAESEVRAQLAALNAETPKQEKRNSAVR